MKQVWVSADWFLVKNGGMGYWDYYRGTLRDYHRDPFPHSLLRTSQSEQKERITRAPQGLV